MNFFVASVLTTISAAVLYVPFINLLYKLKLRDPARSSERRDIFGKKTTVFNQLKGHKAGTPLGGGILFTFVTLVIFFVLYKLPAFGFESFNPKVQIILLTMILFGFVGFVDDYKKIFRKGWGLRIRHYLLFQLILSAIVTYFGVSNNLFSIGVGSFTLALSSTLLFILSWIVIPFTANAVNISDGVDGLSTGLYMIALVPLALIFGLNGDFLSLLFVCILFGALLAYLYFNINPARIFMGDTGAFALGSILGLLALMSNTVLILPIYGAVFFIEITSSVLQWGSKYFRGGKGIFKIAPIHHHFEAIGWSEPKVVFRFWIAGIFSAMVSLAIYFFAI